MIRLHNLKQMKAKVSSCGSNSVPEEYRVESIVTVDERGQMVLPKDIRDKVGIKAGDKLALVTFEKNGKVCCIHLMKADELAGKAREVVTETANLLR
jgi:AbrB family looped-hinge helix DNA binding protein